MLNIVLLLYDLAIRLLREMKTYVHTKTGTQMFTASLFIIAKQWKQSKCPSTDMGKQSIIYLDGRMLFGNKNK